MRVRGAGLESAPVNPDHFRKDATVNQALKYVKPAVIGAVATLAVIYVARRLPVVGPMANNLVQKSLIG